MGENTSYNSATEYKFILKLRCILIKLLSIIETNKKETKQTPWPQSASELY
jgi:hypothetical protein